MNKMKKNKGYGLVFIFLLSFFLTGALWTAAEAVDVTINGPGLVTNNYQLDTNGLMVSSDTGAITLNVINAVNVGVIGGNVNTPGSKVYLESDGVATASAKYMGLDSAGNFSFNNLPDGTYKVFPVLDGVKFTPPYRIITLPLTGTTNRTVINADFTGGPAVSVTYAVYGSVSGSSGSLTLNLGGKTQTISAPGSYIFSGLQPGSYTITASSTGLNVSPQSSPVTISDADMKVDFVTSSKTYMISGYVRDTANAPIPGVVISITNGGICSGSDQTGYYSCNNLTNGTYTLYAAKSGYTITPASASVTISGADKTQPFTGSVAQTYTISGTVTGLAAGANATISLSGAATKSTTTVNGTYSFPGLLAGNYTVTPSLSGYTFNPANYGNLSVASDIVRSFTATPINQGPVSTPLPSGQELIVYDLAAGGTALYKANVTVPSVASFINATKDWATRRDMLVMYGGAACTEAAPTVADHTTIMAGIANASLTNKSDKGVIVNGRTFYYNFQDVNNQSVIIGRLTNPAAPSGCYYVLIYNVSSTPSDYSLTFTATPK